MTLKTGVMMLTIQLCITGINNILQYIQIDSKEVILNHIFLQHYCFYCIVDQINLKLLNVSFRAVQLTM